MPLDHLRGLRSAHVERELRVAWAAGGQDKIEAAKFLLNWKSPRGGTLAAEWLNEEMPFEAFVGLLHRLALVEGIEAFAHLESLIGRGGLGEVELDYALDNLSDMMQFCQGDPRYAKGLRILANHISQASPAIRWTVVFSLGKLGATEYRSLIEAACQDKGHCDSGYVSAVARNALRIFDGDVDVDLHEASEP